MHTCNFDEYPHKVKASHIFELGIMDAKLNVDGRNDLSNFLSGCADHQFHEQIFPNLLLSRRAVERNYDRRKKGRQKDYSCRVLRKVYLKSKKKTGQLEWKTLGLHYDSFGMSLLTLLQTLWTRFDLFLADLIST